jgi:hypothetical protein
MDDEICVPFGIYYELAKILDQYDALRIPHTAIKTIWLYDSGYFIA